jgi:uncharacterized protein DUF5666
MQEFEMHIQSKTVSLVAAGCFAIAAAACGGRNVGSPTAPSVSVPAAPAAPAPSLTGATVTGTVVTGVGASAWSRMAAGMTVTVLNTNNSAAVDDRGHFELHNVPVGHIDLRFSGANADARLGLDDVVEHETIEITVRVGGNAVEVDDHHSETPDGRVQVDGRVAAVDPSARTLRVGSTSVSVPASATVRHGSSTFDFARLQVGELVHVHGARTGSTIVASEVESETEHGAETGDDHGNTPGDDHGNTPGDDHGAGNGAAAELTGAVSGRSGGCPALTFTVGSTTVMTDRSTLFTDTSCSALANGDRVQVKGSTRADKSVLATSVEKKK